MFNLPRNVWLLTLILSLSMSAGAMLVMVGGLLGAALSPVAEFATLPVALMIVGTALGVVPVTRLMGKVGRRPVFVFVAIKAMLAFLLAAYAAYIGSFVLFLLATFLIGIAISGFQQIRFAAMESVSPNLMSKAASTVLLGGLVAAILGPELATFGRNLFDGEFVGSFILMAVLALICAILFVFFKETHHAVRDETHEPVTISDVLTKPVFIIAVSSSVVGYALMSFIMTATPVHMHVAEHHSLEHTKWVIQSHILAMYLPSLISGWLIAKLGIKRVIAMGLAAYLLTIAFALSGTALMNYWVALILLGIGWNFLFLSGTVLLPQSHDEKQKFKVQGINEFMVFSAQAIAALSAGAMLFALGWKMLMLSSFAVICIHILLLLWQSSRIKRQTQLAAEAG